jgi:raffinose/stachyose/melibiose transport system permease protein
VFAVSLIYTAIYSPFAIMLLRTYFLAVPKEVEEAARIDGATPWRVFSKVMLPSYRQVC